jgi:hypothetical protein
MPKFSRDNYVLDKKGCWIHQGALGYNGYGIVTFKNKSYRAHRFQYEQKYGKIPEGMVTDHLCRVRKCVNPDHLEIVTSATNVRRGLLSKLSRHQVKQIRDKYIQGVKQKVLATEYSINQSQISRIINNKRRVYV